MGLLCFQGPSPGRRMDLGPDTQVDFHCRRRAVRCLWWCTRDICDEKCWSQMAVVREKSQAVGGRGISPFKKQRVGQPRNCLVLIGVYQPGLC